ncbi:hypothetical protein PG994_014108 [Apiospora phragmitis]|uniref:Uncharacterized protein n=1 Tax=Apiospora phragmitis TaxID=2905665 RepID=A0ABR1T3D6_9PEZI
MFAKRGRLSVSFTTTSTILNQTTGKIFIDLTYEDGAAAAGKDRPAPLCLKGSFNPAVADRRQHEDEVLKHYLASLTRLGGPALDWRGDEEVRPEYRKCVLSGMGWVLTPEQMQRGERVHAMVERYAAAFEDHKVIVLIEVLPDPPSASPDSDSSLSSS